MEEFNNIFDSHAHYDSGKFNEDRDLVLPGLADKGVKAVMNVGSNIASSWKSSELAQKYDFVYCAAGVHPHDAKEADGTLENEIIKISQNKKMRAIGEIGLDYHYDFSPREVQKEVFIRQIKLAKELDLPVIVHDREAHKDTLDILKKYQPKGVIHSYSGSVEMARELLKLGFYLGFTGVVTFKNAVEPLKVVEMMPLDRILVETDCPYLAPVPYRGKRSDSSMISATISKMAEVKDMSAQSLIDITFENACNIFGIKI